MQFGELENRRWSDEEFLAFRQQVLTRWSTGSQIADLDAAIAYQRRLPPERVFAKRLARARAEGQALFQVGIGHITMAEQIEHMQRAAEAGADLILCLTDTYTRKSRYAQTEQAIERNRRTGEKLLNGFPIVNLGVEARRVAESVPIPVHISSNVDEEAMLNSEMGYACGFTCDYSHSLHDLVQHGKDYPLAQRTQTHQYIARLAAYYTERGAPIELTNLANYGGLMTPSIGLAVSLLSTLIAAEQGAKHLTLHRGLQCHLVQDVAALQAYRELAEEYLGRFGHHDAVLSLHTWPWMGAWPTDEDEAAGLVALCTTIPLLAGVDWVYLKSVHEGLGIPSTEANLVSIKVARQLRRALGSQRLPDSDEIAVEREMIKAETRALLDRTLELGDGDPAVGQLRAVERGVIDVPFSSWIKVNGRVMIVRDRTGAVRYLDTGNLPFSREIVDYHRAKIAERERAEGRPADLKMVIDDVRGYAAELFRAPEVVVAGR